MYSTNDGISVHDSLDDRRHDAGAVYSFLKVIVKWIKESHPNIQIVHYLTDGPTSQYKNSSIFSIVAKHENLLGVQASWLYFEAGHGKGACDGIGAAAKRMADFFVKSLIIHNAQDFANAGNRVPGNIRYVHESKEAIAQSRREVEDLSCHRSIQGTMKCHAVSSPQPGCIALRVTSCYGDCCYSEGKWILGCSGWTTYTLFDDEQPRQPTENESTTDERPSQPTENERTIYERPSQATDNEEQRHHSNIDSLHVGTWVAAVYDSKWYVGVVTEVIGEGEVKVKFMTPGNTDTCANWFKWPSREDTLVLDQDDIKQVVQQPRVKGSRRREVYALCQADILSVTDKFTDLI